VIVSLAGRYLERKAFSVARQMFQDSAESREMVSVHGLFEH